MKMRIFSAIVTLAFSIISIAAQDNKYDKPINKWGQEESLKIVNDSPWAKPYQSISGKSGSDAALAAREQGQSVYGGGSNPRSVARNFGPPPVTMRLHSSEVYRKAVIRLRQIDAGYDKMNEADKAKFDASQQIFLECKICKDYYVLTLAKAAFTKGSDVDEGVFQAMTLADLKGNVKLVNDQGEERELIQFTPPKAAGDSAIFYFKRNDANGKALVTPETKEFKVVFSNTFLDARNRYAYLLPRTFDFKVGRLMVGDRLMF